jgi:hypothetical protein
MRRKVKVSVYCIFLLGIIDIAFSLTRFLTIQLGDSQDFRSFTIIGKCIYDGTGKHSLTCYQNSGVPSMSISVLSSAAYQLSDRIFIGKESTITFRNRDVLLNPVMPYVGQPRADLKR